MKKDTGENVKLAKLFTDVPYDDLVKIREDLIAGSLRDELEERIAAHENPNRVCPVCGTSVHPEKALTLYFGPTGLRQRASFDAEDCLRHFLNSKV